MTALEQTLRTALLHFVWQGVVVAFLLWAVLILMRKRSANARYFASCAALALLVALPIVTACVAYNAPLIPNHGSQLRPTSPPGTWLWNTSGAPSLAWFERLQSLALPVWLLGVALFSVRLAWGSRQVARLRRSGEPADDTVLSMAKNLARRLGLNGPVRLLISSLADGPSVVGWLRPVILLPAATLAGLTPEQLETILAHELAHIRRYDYLVNVLQMVAEALLFYHPAVWWISSRIRDERELCCDDIAVSVCGDALCYARALTRLERMRMLTPKMAVGSTDGKLLYRIQRLTGTATRRFHASRLGGILAVALGLMCVALCLNWARVHAQDAKPHAWTKVGAEPTQAVADAPGVRVDLGSATIVKRSPVNYPHHAIDDEIEGRVEVEASLDAAGRVTSARIVSGPEDLHDAVLASVETWSFKPGTATPIQFSIAFKLPDDDSDGPEVTIESDDSDVEVDLSEVAENVMSEVENSLQEAETALEEAESELTDKAQDLSSQLEEAQHQLESAGKLEENRSLVDGRTLKRLRFLGLSDQVQNDLLKRLPLHEGDKLTKDVLEKVDKILRDLDSHLYCVGVPIEDDDAAVLIRKK